MELALITPVLVLLMLGAYDVGLLTLQRIVWQGSAQVVADLMARDLPQSDGQVTAELARSDCAFGPVVERAGLVLTVRLDCPYTSLTSLMPSSIRITASSVVMPEASESPG